MAKLTPEEFQAKHAKRLKASLEEMRTGVERVTEAPGIAAAAAQDKMLAGIEEAIRSGKWAERVAAVPLQEWKDAMLTKGLGRVSTGIDAAAPKVIRFAEQLLSFQDTLKRQLDTMASLTLEDNIQRMVTWVRGMSEFQPKP